MHKELCVVVNVYISRIQVLLKAEGMTEIVSTRVPDDLAKDLRRIEEVEKADRATVVRKLLAASVAEWKKDYALKLYSQGRVTLWRAARLAGVTLREMMEIAAERGIEFKYTLKDLDEDLAAALKEK